MQSLRWPKHSDLVVLPTAGDGSCALHAVIQGFDPVYQEGRNTDGTPVNRSSLVRVFRDEIAEMLDKPSDGEGSPTWYDRLSRGALEEYAKATKGVEDVPDLSREGFAKHLRSNAWLGQEIVEYVGSVVNIGIFVLLEDESRVIRGIYSLGKENEIYYKGYTKAVIIVSHANRHFSTVGRREMNGEVRTCFDMDDELVREFLQELS
jgi:hypothetical protein